MDAHLGHGVVQAWAGDRHAFDQLGMRFVEGQRRRIHLDGAGRSASAPWGRRRLVLPVREVVLRPGIPELDHGVGGIVVDGPGELERAALARWTSGLLNCTVPAARSMILRSVVPS